MLSLKIVCRLGLLSLGAVTHGSKAALSVQDVSPARFIEGPQSLQEQIVFPTVANDVSFNVYCVANIDAAGRMDQNYCFASEQVEQTFRDAILAAGASATVIPAMVFGEVKPVHLWYRVAFAKKGSLTAIGVYPNWGRDVDKYGDNYEGPQRLGKVPYPTACLSAFNPAVDDITSRTSRHKQLLFYALAAVTIAADGTPGSEVELESSQKHLNRSCVARIRRILTDADYIPGRHNGKFIESVYTETWGRYDAMRLD